MLPFRMRWQSLIMDFFGWRVILSFFAFISGFSLIRIPFFPKNGDILKKCFYICLCTVPTGISIFRPFLDQFPGLRFPHCTNDLRLHTQVWFSLVFWFLLRIVSISGSGVRLTTRTDFQADEWRFLDSKEGRNSILLDLRTILVFHIKFHTYVRLGPQHSSLFYYEHWRRYIQGWQQASAQYQLLKY